jgi:hypothetical protein
MSRLVSEMQCDENPAKEDVWRYIQYILARISLFTFQIGDHSFLNLNSDQRLPLLGYISTTHVAYKTWFVVVGIEKLHHEAEIAV